MLHTLEIHQVVFTLHKMTHEQLKQNPIKPIIKIHPKHEKLDTDEGESNKDDEESTTSTELPEENSASDIHTEATEESKPSEIPQVTNVLNKSNHDKPDSPEDNVTEFEIPKENGEQNIGKENKLLSTNFQVKIENRKFEGLITYSLDQQVFKF